MPYFWRISFWKVLQMTRQRCKRYYGTPCICILHKKKVSVPGSIGFYGSTHAALSITSGTVLCGIAQHVRLGFAHLNFGDLFDADVVHVIPACRLPVVAARRVVTRLRTPVVFHYCIEVIHGTGRRLRRCRPDGQLTEVKVT